VDARARRPRASIARPRARATTESRSSAAPRVRLARAARAVSRARQCGRARVETDRVVSGARGRARPLKRKKNARATRSDDTLGRARRATTRAATTATAEEDAEEIKTTRRTRADARERPTRDDERER